MLTSILGRNTVLDLKLGGWLAKDNWVPMDGNLDEPHHYDGLTGQASNGIWSWSRTTYTKIQANATLSHFADDFIHGNHEFKVGVQYTRGSSLGISSYSGGVVYYDWGGVNPTRLISRTLTTTDRPLTSWGSSPTIPGPSRTG